MKGISEFKAQAILFLITVTLLSASYFYFNQQSLQGYITLNEQYHSYLQSLRKKVGFTVVDESTLMLYNYGDEPLRINGIFDERGECTFRIKVFNNNGWVDGNEVPPRSLAILMFNQGIPREITILSDNSILRLIVRG